MGAVRQKEGPQSLHLLGAWGGVQGCPVKVSVHVGRTLWDCGRDREKGRGRTICFAAVICGGPWGKKGELAGRCSPNVSPGSGGQTVFMVNLDDGVL